MQDYFHLRSEMILPAGGVRKFNALTKCNPSRSTGGGGGIRTDGRSAFLPLLTRSMGPAGRVLAGRRERGSKIVGNLERDLHDHSLAPVTDRGQQSSSV